METNHGFQSCGRSLGVHCELEGSLFLFAVLFSALTAEAWLTVQVIAKQMEETRNAGELWVTRKATKRLGRRVAWASDSRDMMD